MAQIHLVHDPWPKNKHKNVEERARCCCWPGCLHWHIFYFCFPWEIFSTEIYGFLEVSTSADPRAQEPESSRTFGIRHSICFCFNSYKIFYANLAVYCCRLWLRVWNVTNFPRRVRAGVRVPVVVPWEIIQQFSHLLFESASFPLQQQFSPDLLPQLWSSIFIYLALGFFPFSLLLFF